MSEIQEPVEQHGTDTAVHDSELTVGKPTTTSRSRGLKSRLLDLIDPSAISGTGDGQPTGREGALRHIARLYLAFAVVLVPWDAYLAVSLPLRTVSLHYRGTWVGFDIFLILVLAWIGLCAWRRDPRIVLSAAVGGTLLCADAWFDVTTSAPGSAHWQAIASALLLELPCATLCFLLARRSLAVVTARSGGKGRNDP